MPVLSKKMAGGVLASVALVAPGITALAAPVAHAATKKYTIALVTGNSVDPFYLSMVAGAKAEAKKLGVDIIWQSSATFSPETQTPILQTLIAKHPNALLLAPTDPKALNPVLKQYTTAHIPIMTLDTKINNTSILAARFTDNNAQGGVAAADACEKIMKGSGSATVLYATPGATASNVRGAAFIAEMKKKAPKVKVYTELDNNVQSTAATQVSSLLLAHSDMKCVFGTNGFGAEGAVSAIQTNHDQSKVAVVAYDAEPQLVSLLKKGQISIIIAQKPAEEGADAVQDAYNLLTGKKSKVKTYVTLSNITMTKANINNPSISKWIYKS